MIFLSNNICFIRIKKLQRRKETTIILSVLKIKQCWKIMFVVERKQIYAGSRLFKSCRVIGVI